MSLAVLCAIIGIALVATTVAVTAVIGGDMLRREWLRKRRWKRLERDVILRAQPEESPGRPGDSSTAALRASAQDDRNGTLRYAQDDREEANRNLAFALLNARYNDSHRRTILSSELSLTAVRREDPAISSRIMEKARGYVLEAPSAQPNWREKEC